VKLVIISGRSGSGKSTALNVLEDAGYYTIDNLPAGLLTALVEETRQSTSPEHEKLALCIDARNISQQLQAFPALLSHLPEDVETSVIYLDAHDDTLIKRFSETRRRHPLSDKMTALQEALDRERDILQPIANSADITIDTSQMLFHELRDYVQQVVLRQTGTRMSTLIQSFGFKKGLPLNADLVFDVRCLPNPHWVTSLRSLTGADPAVVEFLQNEPTVEQMIADICQFLENWLPRYEGNNRPYTTVAVGCTGGQHRSVYLANRLYQYLSERGVDVKVRHRELAGLKKLPEA
jgi:UPF0042 nucleotide-binding protein